MDTGTLSPARLRLGIPQGLAISGLDATVAQSFYDATARLGQACVQLTDEQIPLIDQVSRVYAKGTIMAVEAADAHRAWLVSRANDYDPLVRRRIESGCAVSAPDYVQMLRERGRLVRAMDARLSDIDALVLPTVAVVAPKINEVPTRVEEFITASALIARNTSLANFFDLCAISLPVPFASGLPVGLMLVARNGHDQHPFRMAAAVERLLAT